MNNIFPISNPQVKVLLISDTFEGGYIFDATNDCSNLNTVATITYERKEHHDIFKKYDVEALEFIGKTRDLVEEFAKEYEFSKKIQVEIQRLGANNAYSTDFKGVIDNTNIEQKSRVLVCPLIKEEVLETFLSKIDKKVEITTPTTITLPENTIVLNSVGAVPKGEIQTGGAPPILAVNPFADFVSQPLPHKFNPQINKFDPYQWQGVFTSFSQLEDTVIMDSGADGIEFVFESLISFKSVLTFNNPTSAPTSQAVVKIKSFAKDNVTPFPAEDQVNALIEGNLIDQSAGVIFVYEYILPISSLPCTIQPDRLVRLEFEVNYGISINASASYVCDDPDQFFKFTFNDVDAESFHLVVRVNQALTEICNSIQGLSFDDANGYFATGGNGEKEAITTGYQIRQFPYADKPIQVSFQKLYDGFKALKNIGWGFKNNQIFVEDVRSFYKDEVIFEVSEPNDSFTRVVNRDFLYSAIALKAAFNENEEINVEKQSFQFDRDWDTEFDNIKNEYEIDYSSLYTDVYDILVTKRKRFAQDEDWELDKELFSVYLNTLFNAPSGQFNFTSVSNFDFPDQLINAENSPKQIIIRHLNMIAIGLQKYKIARLTNFNRNVDFETVAAPFNDFGLPGGTTVNEKTDLLNLDFNLNPAFMSPYKIIFEYPITSDFQAAIDSNKFGKISITKNGRKYRGWINKIEIKDLEGGRIADVELIEEIN